MRVHSQVQVVPQVLVSDCKESSPRLIETRAKKGDLNQHIHNLSNLSAGNQYPTILFTHIATRLKANEPNQSLKVVNAQTPTFKASPHLAHRLLNKTVLSLFQTGLNKE
jgi:hypothetical protein